MPTNEKDDELDFEFDFANSVPNPYAERLKQQITIRMDKSVIDYFKAQADRIGMPYQTLINLYLRDCVKKQKTPTFSWD